jgi:hypothetical protein
MLLCDLVKVPELENGDEQALLPVGAKYGGERFALSWDWRFVGDCNAVNGERDGKHRHCKGGEGGVLPW